MKWHDGSNPPTKIFGSFGFADVSVVCPSPVAEGSGIGNPDEVWEHQLTSCSIDAIETCHGKERGNPKSDRVHRSL